MVEFETEPHYARLAETYDANWAHSGEYVAWMNEHIDARLGITAGDRVADLGAGTGLFLRALAEHVTADNPILCIDPSQPMLDNLPDDPRLAPVCATAEQVARGEVRLAYDQLDALVAKEAVHHFYDLSETLRGLAGLLAPGGRLLVVTLPPRLDYPLFAAALDRFAANQPAPEDIADALRAAGLDTRLEYEQFPVRVGRDHYLDLVANRWMSMLSTWTEAELAAGLEEMRAAHPEEELRFVDRFAFIRGVRPA
ncbi:MAG: methyltransferase [Streptosporangiales bacterium]